MKYFILLSILFSFQTFSLGVDCQLTDIVRVAYSADQIKRDSYREMAKGKTIITGLNEKNPILASDNNAKLIKVKEHNGSYWLISRQGMGVVVSWMIDTNKKTVIQIRQTSNILGFYSQSWFGKCNLINSLIRKV